MPLMQLWALARRRWLVLLVGACVSVVATVHVRATPPVYFAQVNALLLLPTSSELPNALTASSESVVATAGVLQRMVVGQGAGAQPVSDSVTLVGQGIRRGYSVRLPNTGGQWANLFSDPFLDVQAAGSSPAEVRRQMQGVLARLSQTLRTIQDEQGVRPQDRIVMQINPLDPVVGASSGNPVRAAGATLLLGLLITFALALLVERARPAGRSSAMRVEPAAARHLQLVH